MFEAEPDAEERPPEPGPVFADTPGDGALKLAADALDAAVRLGRWIHSTNLLGYDPYDALRSPLLARVAVGRRGRRIAIQALRRLPVNPRPLLGIRPYASAKALGLIAAAAAKLFHCTGDEDWRRLAERSALGACDLAIETDNGVGWGYPFDVELRWGFYAANTPNVIATVFTANSLLTASDILGRPDLARLPARAASFLDVLATGIDERFYMYVPGSPRPIHNANLLAAALRTRLAVRAGEAIPDDAIGALDFSLRRQRKDGSWPYGEGRGLGWVDGFHTAYVLSALIELQALTSRADLEEAIARGAAYYVENLFDAGGRPRYYAGRTYPLDSHNAATAISALAKLQAYEPRAFELGGRVLRWSLSRLQTRSGWFLYQRGRLHVKRIPYLRWSNAHMLQALAEVVSQEAGSPSAGRRFGARGERAS